MGWEENEKKTKNCVRGSRPIMERWVYTLGVYLPLIKPESGTKCCFFVIIPSALAPFLFKHLSEALLYNHHLLLEHPLKAGKPFVGGKWAFSCPCQGLVLRYLIQNMEACWSYILNYISAVKTSRNFCIKQSRMRFLVDIILKLDAPWKSST